MPSFFKNYSLVKAIYLLTRFNKTKFISRNTKNTERNGVNKQNKHIHMHTEHSEKDNTRKDCNENILLTPPFLWEKSESPFFSKISQTQTPPFIKTFKL